MMDIPDDLFPFRDRQQDPVYGFCPICGDEIRDGSVVLAL